MIVCLPAGFWQKIETTPNRVSRCNPTTIMSYIFSIEGNIGSGKSTLVSRIKEAFSEKSINDRKVICVQEPVSIWNEIKDKSGTTILEKFYADQEKYAFPFQMMAYISRLAILKETIAQNPQAIIITERCTDTDKNVFAQMMYDTGKIEDVNFAIYLKWYDAFLKEVPITGHVYVETHHTMCDERIKKRSRTGEDGIPLEYLKSCHDYHENWLKTKPNKFVIDGNYDISSDEYDGFLKEIEIYIESKTTRLHDNFADQLVKYGVNADRAKLMSAKFGRYTFNEIAAITYGGAKELMPDIKVGELLKMQVMVVDMKRSGHLHI